ncbi:site-specific integrase [halophilic archaeon]|nr:site-specific integrase [halophilic archaeon]
MSDVPTATGSSSSAEKVADAFGKTTDPLAEFEETFNELDIDPFIPFIEDVLFSKNLHSDTRRNYRSVFGDWREHMQSEGRSPACPSDEHVVRFIEWQSSPDGADNHPRTVKGKLRKLNRAYEYWQDSAAFPHPQDYNPFTLARNKVNLAVPDGKQHRRIPVEELREMVRGVTHLRNRAIICFQFKLGLRAGEVANIQLADIAMENAEIQRHYPEIAAEDRLAGRSNAIYIPPGDERPGNKSGRARMLPLDDELRRLLVRYLLVRPENDEPWLFLSETSHTQMDHKGVNSVWKKELYPEYAETEEYRPVTSHFGRHRFSTWWRVEQEVNRELVKYMRGDSVEKGSMKEPIDSYLHTYYEDIEQLYREKIYRLGI